VVCAHCLLVRNRLLKKRVQAVFGDHQRRREMHCGHDESDLS
jgi:hypothetical protein